MATVSATDLNVILLAIQARLMASLSWPDERVIIDARNDNDHDKSAPTHGHQYIRLGVKARTLDMASVEGRGRVYPRCDAVVSVTLRTRCDLDPAVSDQIALTDPGTEEIPQRGHLPFEHDIVDSLLTFYPVDADSNWLCCEPLKVRNGSSPLKPPKGWAQSVWDVSVAFLLDLDQDYQ